MRALGTYFFLSMLLWGVSALAEPLVARACTVYNSGVATPAGYGTAWNVFAPSSQASQKGNIVTADCTQGSFEAQTKNVGMPNIKHFRTYKQGYFWSDSKWKPFSFQGAAAGTGNWIEGGAYSTGNIPYQTDPTYFAAYTCSWVYVDSPGQDGGKNEWKCGCRDSTCAESFWQLQAVRNPNAASAQFDVNAYLSQFAPPSGSGGGGSGGGFTGGASGGGTAPSASIGGGGIPADACIAWDGSKATQAQIDEFNKVSLKAYETREQPRPTATIAGTTITRNHLNSLCILNNDGQIVCERKAADDKYLAKVGEVTLSHANMQYLGGTCGFEALKIPASAHPYRSGFTVCVPAGANWIGKDGGQILQHFQLPGQGPPPAQVDIDESNGEFIVIVRNSVYTKETHPNGEKAFNSSKSVKRYDTGVRVQSGQCYTLEDSFKHGANGHYKVWINGKQVASYEGRTGFGSGSPSIQYNFGPYMYDVKNLVQLIFDKTWIAK